MTNRLLLDTHVVLWWLLDDPTLEDEIKATIDQEIEVYLSAASVWEIAIKQALGRFDFVGDLADEALASDLSLLSMTGRHAAIAGRLPPIHRDPFDRMLIAQAQGEDLTLVTRDRHITGYDVAVLQA